MESMILEMARMMFQSSLIDDVSGFMTGVYNAVSTILSNDVMITIVNSFAGIAVSLMTLYFFWDLTGQASKDLLTLEKLVIAFIKLMLACTILLVLPDIISGLVNIGKAMYEWVASADFKNSIFTDENMTYKYKLAKDTVIDKFPTLAEVKDAKLWQFKLPEILNFFGIFFISLIVNLVNFITKVTIYFVAISNAVMIIARAVFSPIAVVQLFEDGSKSQGMKYLKCFAADCLQMAAIVIILYASSKLTGALTSELYSGAGSLVSVKGNVTTVDLTAFQNSLTFGKLHIFVLPQLAATGAVMGASKLVHDVIG